MPNYPTRGPGQPMNRMPGQNPSQNPGQNNRGMNQNRRPQNNPLGKLFNTQDPMGSINKIMTIMQLFK